MDPRDGLHASTASCCTEVNDDHCKCCQLSTNDGRLFIALSVHLCRTKLMTRCYYRRAVVKFSKLRVWDKVLEGRLKFTCNFVIDLRAYMYVPLAHAGEQR